MANGVEVARAFVTIIPTTQGAQAAITSAIAPAAASAGTKAGLLAGAPMLAGITGALSKFVAPAAIIGGLTLIGKKGAEAFQAVERGANNVITATGATGKAAEELVGAYKNVSKHVVGDFGEIGATVGELNTRLGLTGTELESASEEMMKYAKVTGQDAVAATKDVASMMRNTGIPTEELADTLGKLTVAGQAAGIDVAKLAQNTTKYNAVMKQLGLSTDEQIALMAKFEQSGADTNSILNAMKKGVANWAKEGKDAKTEFQNFVQGVQDGTVTAGDAVEIFGSRGGLSMYEAAQKGQLSFEEMYDAITSASASSLDQVYKDTLTASEKIDLAWQNITIAAGEMFAPVMEGFSMLLDQYVVPAAQGIADVFTEANGVADVFVGLSELATNAIGDMVANIIDSLPAAIDGFTDMVDGFLNALANGENPMMSQGESLFSKIGAAVERSWPKIKTALGRMLDTIGQSILKNGPTILKNGAVALGKMAVGFAKALPGLLKELGSVLLSLIRRIPSFFGQILTKGKELVGKIGEGISKNGPKVLSKIGEVIAGIPGKIAGFFGSILTKGGELVGRIATGISQKGPTVLTKIGETIGKIPGKIGEFFSSILSKGGELVGKIVTGIGNNGPKVLSKIGEIIGKIPAKIGEFFSGIFGKAADLGGKIVSGLGSKAGEVRNKAGEIIGGARDKVASFADSFKSKASGLMGNVVGGFNTKRWDAIGTASSITAESRDKVGSYYDSFNRQGSSLIGGFAGGIWRNRGEATGSAGSVGGSAADNVYNRTVAGMAWDAGHDFDLGFAAGIRSGEGAVGTAAYNLGYLAVQRVRAATKSASPSKEAMKAGRWFSEGFAIGIEDEADYAAQAATKLGTAAVTALDAQAPTWSVDGTGRELVGVTITGNNFNVTNEMDARKAAEIIGTEVTRQLQGRL